MSEGVEVIENSRLRVEVSGSGAELISIYDKEIECERLWNADPRVWNRHAPILFPFVGRVADGRYRYQGKTYEMKTQHGFARDREFRLVNSSPLTYELQSDEKSREIYPFDFILRVIYDLDSDDEGKLNITWQVENTGESDMVYSIGGHPAFMCPIGDKKQTDYKLYFAGHEKSDSIKYYLIEGDTGLLNSKKSYELEITDGYASITDEIFNNDALIFDGEKTDKVGIVTSDNKPFITVEAVGFPQFGIWSKPGAPFICLEPWIGRTDDYGFSGEITEKNGICTLKQGKSQEHKWSIILGKDLQ